MMYDVVATNRNKVHYTWRDLANSEKAATINITPERYAALVAENGEAQSDLFDFKEVRPKEVRGESVIATQRRIMRTWPVEMRHLALMQSWLAEHGDDPELNKPYR